MKKGINPEVSRYDKLIKRLEGEKMKILQVGLGNNPGGMEAFVMNYFRELARQGVSFDFVSMYGTIAYEKEILELGGRVFYVPNIKKKITLAI